METKRKSIVGLTVAGILMCGATGAWADGPKRLNSRQLDQVTAAGAVVISSTDALATGSLSLTSTTSNSLVGGGNPYPQQPGLTNTVGVAEGTATAVGSNFGQPGTGPASTGTAVETAGIAQGNQVISSTINQTFQGAGGVQFQAGWTFIYGGYAGL